jgi:hypothetical protein
LKKHPDQVQAGEITEIYYKLKTGLRDLGFVLEWRGTSPALQFNMPDDCKADSSKKWDSLGAIQYYGSDEAAVQPPCSVGLKFYRTNLPNEKWLQELEAIKDNPYRQDKIGGPAVDEKSLHIQFVFTDYDPKTLDFISSLMSLLERLLICDV